MSFYDFDCSNKSFSSFLPKTAQHLLLSTVSKYLYFPTVSVSKNTLLINCRHSLSGRNYYNGCYSQQNRFEKRILKDARLILRKKNILVFYVKLLKCISSAWNLAFGDFFYTVLGRAKDVAYKLRDVYHFELRKFINNHDSAYAVKRTFVTMGLCSVVSVLPFVWELYDHVINNSNASKLSKILQRQSCGRRANGVL